MVILGVFIPVSTQAFIPVSDVTSIMEDRASSLALAGLSLRLPRMRMAIHTTDTHIIRRIRIHTTAIRTEITIRTDIE